VVITSFAIGIIERLSRGFAMIARAAKRSASEIKGALGASVVDSIESKLRLA
jgi:hypothetical protein